MSSVPIFGSAATSPAQHAAFHQALQRIHQQQERTRASERRAAHGKDRLRGLSRPSADGFAECTPAPPPAKALPQEPPAESATLTDFLLIALAATALLLLAGYALVTLGE